MADLRPIDPGEVIWTPSPNFDDRKLPITMLVMHYTGMESASAAIDWLANPEAKVSAHYVVHEDGQIIQMVAEKHRAWHAGRSHWRDVDDVNSASVGIEIINPGHEWGYRPFPEAQMDSVVRLTKAIVDRYDIPRANVVGHSDVAPSRKEDPGELFNWARLARHHLALSRPTKNLMDPDWTDGGFMLALERFGYDISDGPAAIRAFERRFRPEMIEGLVDGELRAILLSLLLDRERGDAR